MHLETPWALAGTLPTLPFPHSGPVDATAVGTGLPVGRALFLTTPWTSADVRLPARATTHPGATTIGLVPVPRQTAEGADVAAPTRTVG
jgi:hypothetical protein